MTELERLLETLRRAPVRVTREYVARCEAEGLKGDSNDAIDDVVRRGYVGWSNASADACADYLRTLWEDYADPDDEGLRLHRVDLTALCEELK